MALVKISEWEKSFESNYQTYCLQEKLIADKRYRNEEETIFDAISSSEADFTSDEDGQRIAELIRNIK